MIKNKCFIINRTNLMLILLNITFFFSTFYKLKQRLNVNNINTNDLEAVFF